MIRFAIIPFVILAMAGCSTAPLEVADTVDFVDPVLGDSFEFCPPSSEIDARLALHWDEVMALSEPEFVEILHRHEMRYQRIESDSTSACGQQTMSPLRAIYHVNGMPDDRLHAGDTWISYDVTINHEGMVQHIEELFVVITQ